MKAPAAPLVAALLLAATPAPAAITAFSSAAGGVVPAPWQVVTVPKIQKHTRYDIIADGDEYVLRAAADGSYANLVHPLAGERGTHLSWRWRVLRPIDRSDLRRRDGDDVPARVCVLFDVPLERLALVDRLKVKAGRALFDPKLPAASICYVWDRRIEPGTWLANAYTDRVQMLVLRRGGYGAWAAESRDLAADFARAFPHEAQHGLPPLAAIGVAADGDNTGGSSLALFGDLRLEAK